jgi:hypothetical protein
MVYLLFVMDRHASRNHYDSLVPVGGCEEDVRQIFPLSHPSTVSCTHLRSLSALPKPSALPIFPFIGSETWMTIGGSDTLAGNIAFSGTQRP